MAALETQPAETSDNADADDGIVDDGGESERDGDDNVEVSDNDSEMIIMDPDHPLMKRFQAALKSILTKQNEHLTLEHIEMDKTLQLQKKEREDLGVELYGAQQELARYQMILETKHDTYVQKNQQRENQEQELADIRSLYKNLQSTVAVEKKKGAELQSEVEKLTLQLFYLNNAKEDVRSDIAVMRRAAEKVESEVAHAESEKQEQDLYVDRLVEQVDKLTDEVAMYEAQITAQREESRAAKDALMEAKIEMEALAVEKKQLFQHWNSSLLGISRRNEAHCAMQEAAHQQFQKVMSLEAEMEGLKKSIQKEQEENERLTLILARTERDSEIIKKQLGICKVRFDTLKVEFTTYTRMLHETEQALKRIITDKVIRESEFNFLQKQIEHELQEKLSLEDQIMECIRAQLSMEKASQYTQKITYRTRERTKQLETQMAEDENRIAHETLEDVNVRDRIERIKRIKRNVEEEIARKNTIVNLSEIEIVKCNAIIERKQTFIDAYNKKLDYLISSTGGLELGPLEIQINSAIKLLESSKQGLVNLQQLWLRQQSELVRLSAEKDIQYTAIEKYKHQLTILQQQKIRTESEIEQQAREEYSVHRSMHSMEKDLVKLNLLLFHNRKVGTTLEHNNAFIEYEFLGSLKEAEMESIKLTQQLDEVKEEKERLLNSLVEAERQIMLWEKKTQLARETRAAIDSDFGQGEIKAMKTEIHRMKVRYSQLMKMQEKIIQSMEKSVSRRDTIITNGEALSRMYKKVTTKDAFEKKLVEIRKKINNLVKDNNGCDDEICRLQEQQKELISLLEEKRIMCQTLQDSAHIIGADVEQKLEIKDMNLIDLLARQQRMKYYQQVKEDRYSMVYKSESVMNAESNNQEINTNALNFVLNQLNRDFPHAYKALRPATLTLKTVMVT